MQRTQEKKKDVPKADGERDHQLRCASFIISAQCSESKLTKTSVLFKITHTQIHTGVNLRGVKYTHTHTVEFVPYLIRLQPAYRLKTSQERA